MSPARASTNLPHRGLAMQFRRSVTHHPGLLCYLSTRFVPFCRLTPRFSRRPRETHNLTAAKNDDKHTIGRSAASGCWAFSLLMTNFDPVLLTGSSPPASG